MKKFLIILCCLIFCACATTQTPEFKQVEHLVKIEIASQENANVKIGDGIQKVMDVESSDLQLSNFTRIANNVAFMSLTFGLSTTDEKNLWFDRKYIEKNHPEITDIIIYLNSPGGNAFSGISLADFVNGLNKKFNTTVYASGIVASAAIPVLAVCENRIATSGTVFMVHEPGVWTWPGMSSYSDILASKDMMDMFREKYIEILAKNSKLSAKEWEAKEGKTTWFSSKQALEWGLIDRIE